MQLIVKKKHLCILQLEIIDKKFVKFLLDNDANSKNINIWAPIDFAINESHMAIIKYFLRKVANVTEESKLFQHAIINSKIIIVKFLLRRIIDVNFKIYLYNENIR